MRRPEPSRAPDGPGAPSKLAREGLDQVLARAGLSGPAAAVAQEGGAVPASLDALEAAGLVEAACRLMAHALPGREAVWWACMCARHTAEPAQAADRAALDAAELWVRRQTDAARREAFARAEGAGFAGPEAWAAVAAFWSGDSLSPPEQPKVPPAPHLCGTAVAGSVALAAARARPERREARLRRFLAGGREIAAGGAGRLGPEES